MNPNDEVTPVSRLQLAKELPRFGICLQRSAEVRGQVGDRWSPRVAVVRRRRRQTGPIEQAGRLECRPPLSIVVGPLARGLSRCGLEGVSVVIETFDKAVDPSEAQRLTNGVFVGKGLHPRVRLVEDEPDAWARRMVLFQPRPPLWATPNS